MCMMPSAVGVGSLLLVLFSGGSAWAAAAGDHRVADAMKQQDDASVRTLIAEHADVNAPQPDGATALHWAAYWDDVPSAELLIGAAAQVNAVNENNVTPLSLACVNGSATMVAALLAAGADPNIAQTPGEVGPGGSGGFTPLLFAARVGDVESLRLLVEHGADVNEVGADGSSPLIVATLRGHVPAAIFLLSKGADANAHGPGYAALHWAAGSWETQLTGPYGIESQREDEWNAMRGLKGAARIQLIEALLSHGADPNIRLTREPPRYGYANLRFHVSLAGATPFLLAARAADTEVMRLLVAHGANPTHPTNLHTTPLMVAAGIGRVPNESVTTEASTIEAVKLAIELGGEVNAADDIGDTALHGAAHIRSAAV